MLSEDWCNYRDREFSWFVERIALEIELLMRSWENDKIGKDRAFALLSSLITMRATPKTGVLFKNPSFGQFQAEYLSRRDLDLLECARDKPGKVA